MGKFNTVAALSLFSFSVTAQPMYDDFESARAQLSGHDLKLHFTPRGTLTEFFNTTLKHYFRTADPAEVAGIQNGAAGPGWTLTQDNFMAWTADFKPTNALPVCRFYAPGPNSHFFTINAGECEFVKKDPGWKYEGTAFYALAPVNGQCITSDYQPVYRLYNDRFTFNDSNHKFTTSLAVYNSMLTGTPAWKGEGVVMCAPLPTTFDQQKTEQLIGGTWTIPWRFGNGTYVDRLTYTDLTQSTTSPFSIYAVGTNVRNYLTLGGYSSSISGWLVLSSLFRSGGYPYDAFVITAVNGNTLTGCYFFLTSASSSLSGCAWPFTGTR